MIFWESCEAYRLAFDNLFVVAKPTASYFNAEFEDSSLNDLKIKLRYIPIVMPESSLKNYPERSRAKVKEAIYLCAPQLDYQTFVDGTLEAQCVEYVRGIALSSPHLKKFGATPEQVADFDAIMAAAPEQLYQMIKAA